MRLSILDRTDIQPQNLTTANQIQILYGIKVVVVLNLPDVAGYFNTVPCVVVSPPTIKLFHCYFKTVILLVRNLKNQMGGGGAHL